MNIKECNSFYDSLEKLAKQNFAIADAVAKSSIIEQQTRLINNLKIITPAITSIINNSAYEQLLINTSRLAETINKNLSPHLINITNSTYDKLLNCDLSTLTALKKAIFDLNIPDLNINSIEFKENGNITYENETFTPEEINSNTSELVLKASTGTLDFSDIKEHPMMSITLLIIFYILFTLIIPDMFSSIKKYIKENYLKDKNKITDKDYKNFRIIISENTNVKRNPDVNSDTIAKLCYLNIVKVVEICPYWLRIEYTDITNKIEISGWISKKNTADFSQETENLLKKTNN